MFSLAYILSLRVWFLLGSIYFNFYYFIENSHPIFFLSLSLLCESSPDYYVTISSEASIRCDQKDNFLHRHLLPCGNFCGIKGIQHGKENLRDDVV